MNSRTLLSTTATTVATATAALALWAAPAQAVPAAAGTVYVVQVHGVDANEDAVALVAKDMTGKYGGELRRLYSSAMQGFSVTLTKEQMTAYLKDKRVDSVTSDRVFHTAGTAQDATAREDVPWGLDRVDQRDLPLDGEADFGGQGSGVHVYVVDTGVRTGHQEFDGRATGAYDALTQEEGGDSGSDCNGHGTAQAAVVAGAESGLAKQAQVSSVRALDCEGNGTLEHLVSAVDWITAHAEQPAVVSLGFSGNPGSVLDLQLYQMTKKGIAYTAPAGNGDANGQGVDACDTTPGRQTTALTVSATDPTDTRPAWSNFGSCVHLFAPGVDIPTAGTDSDTAAAELTGTSAAAAHVAGAAAVYLGEHPDTGPVDLDKALAAGATTEHVQSPGEQTKNLLLYAGSSGCGAGRIEP